LREPVVDFDVLVSNIDLAVPALRYMSSRGWGKFMARVRLIAASLLSLLLAVKL
jgi:hypothetical protein